MSTTLILIIVAVILVIFVISLYNRLIAFKNNRENAFADIDVQLKQRHDLIPQLVSSVKGYMEHEAGVLTRVTEARARAMSATSIEGKIAAEQELGAALQGLKVQVEAYPDLKANTNFLDLQQQLSQVENHIQMARRYYNGTVRENNILIESFPSNLIANMFAFKKGEYFELETSHERTTPHVRF
jgi:LemA protein